MIYKLSIFKRGIGRIYRVIYGWEVGRGQLWQVEGRYCTAGSANGEENKGRKKNKSICLKFDLGSGLA